MESYIDKAVRLWAEKPTLTSCQRLSAAVNGYASAGYQTTGDYLLWVARIKQVNSGWPTVEVLYNTLSNTPITIGINGVGRWLLMHPIFSYQQLRFFFKVQMNSGKGQYGVVFHDEFLNQPNSTFPFLQAKWVSTSNYVYVNDFDITVEMRFYPDAIQY